MITKCRFCEYSKESKLSHDILRVIVSNDLPEEDYFLWVRRLVATLGNRDYNSVKIHMGIKHPTETYKYISPATICDEEEKAIINGK